MPLDLDKDVIIKTVLGSLMSFLFYGYIELKAKFDALEAKQEQRVSQNERELKNIWIKYNVGQKMFMDHCIKEMEYKVKQSEKWEQFHKEKSKQYER